MPVSLSGPSCPHFGPVAFKTGVLSTGSGGHPVAVTQALQKKLVYEPLDTLRDTFHPSKAHMSFDLIIKNGTIVDGSGQTEPYRADVGIQGEQISSIGDLSSVEAADSIDATGLIVAPGFIDVHVHGEIALLGGPIGSIAHGHETDQYQGPLV